MPLALRSADLSAALRAAADWHAAASREELESAALTALYDLVPSDGVGWNDVDLRSNAVTLRVAPLDYRVEPLETLGRLIHEHPIVAHAERSGARGALKFSDFVSVRELHRLEIYSDFFRPLRIEEQLAALVSVTPDRIIGIAFNRDRRSFTERERSLLNLLEPHLGAACRRLELQQRASERIAALERGLDGRVVVALTPDGRIADAGERGAALLDRWFGRVPEALAPGVYAGGADVELRVRELRGTPPLLLLDERRLGPDPQRVRDLGLSARQAEIVTLAGRGLTDAAIAAELYLSPRTVAKHLEHAYARLGVHSRAEAWARLMGEAR